MVNSLIIGGTGQDGSILANHLLKRCQNVTVTFRPTGQGFSNLEYFGIRESVRVLPFVLGQSSQLFNYLSTHRQDHIYILAGISDTHLSYYEPAIFFQENTTNLIALIYDLTILYPNAKLFVFGSLDEYMSNKDLVTEESNFAPVSPYGISRVSTHMFVQHLMDKNQFNGYYGIFGSHESALRNKKFFTAKTSVGLHRFLKSGKPFSLGDLSSLRDWGLANEYMEIVCELMNSSADSGDYMFVTGKLQSCEEYLVAFLKRLGIEHFKESTSSSEKFFDHKTKRLICESTKSIFSKNTHNHPLCSNDKIYNALRKRPSRGIDSIIDEYISHYSLA